MPFLPIPLAEGFYAVVKQSDPVTVGQIIAKRNPVEEKCINIAEQLGVKPQQAMKYLKKMPGETIEVGDVIAKKKSFFGGTMSEVISNTSGIVIRYERGSGALFIKLRQGDEKAEAIFSPIDGTISLCNNEKILIEPQKDSIIGSVGSGKESQAELILLKDSTENVEIYNLSVDAIGKVVVGSIFTKDVLVKGVAMGVAGIVATKILESDIQYIRSRNSTIPLLIIEHEDLNRLKHWHGRRVFLNGEGKTLILLNI